MTHTGLYGLLNVEFNQTFARNKREYKHAMSCMIAAHSIGNSSVLSKHCLSFFFTFFCLTNTHSLSHGSLTQADQSLSNSIRTELNGSLTTVSSLGA